jgi:hypothetical protein
MQATTSGRMTHQPTLLVAGAALVIATSLMVAGVASQNIRLGATSATRAVPSAQAVERALVTVRAGEHQGLRPGWADTSAIAAGATRLPDKTPGHVGLSELAAGAITPGIVPNLPAGNWGQNQVPSASQDEVVIPANFFAPGVPSVDVLYHKADAGLSPSSPSYSELVNQRKGEKYRIQAAEAPDAFNKAGFSIR